MKKKEIDDYRTRHESEKAAELKAKLALVELRDKPGYGRAPKKVGEIVCDTGIKNGYREERATFVLRLDVAKGEFIAEHGDIWYVSTSREALQAKMDLVARVTLDVKWTRYIAIDYTAYADRERGDYWSHGQSELEVKTARKKRKVHGVSLRWSIVEYSSPMRLPGDDGERWMKRDVDDKGKVEEKQESVTTLPDGLVPHTPEREALLRSIVDTLTLVDAKLVGLFGGEPEEVGARLDSAAGGSLLLASGDSPKKAKRS